MGNAEWNPSEWETLSGRVNETELSPYHFVFLVLSAANTKTACATHWTCHSAKCIGVINKINDHFLIFR